MWTDRSTAENAERSRSSPSGRAPTFAELFDPDFLAALAPFSLHARRVARDGRPAEQVSRDRGFGLEFADFKSYVPGDDLRAIDWNIYRRLGRLFIRVFEEHRDLPVYLLIDRSSSMYLETPPRIGAGVRVALALASIALGQHDSVGLFSFSGVLNVDARAAAGKHRLVSFAERLAALDERDRTDLTGILGELAGHRLRQGLLVVVSDFFDPQGADEIARALALCRHRLLLVQLVRKTDADPTLHAEVHGDVRLRDCESGDAVDLTITPATLARYRQSYREFNDRLTEFATGHDAGFVRVDADEDVLDQLGGMFEAGRLTV